MKQKTDTSKIAKAVVDEIERRQVENEPLSPSASIWFILVVMNLLIRLDLVLVGKDWWLKRYEYDGDECWEYKEQPKLQENHKKLIRIKATQEEQPL